MVDRRPRYWRATSFLLAFAAMLAIAGAMGVLVAVFQGIGSMVADPVAKRYLAALAVVAGVLLILGLFCTVLLVTRYMFSRARAAQGRHPPTEYVDAWRIAGERLSLPEKDRQDGDDEEGDESA